MQPPSLAQPDYAKLLTWASDDTHNPQAEVREHPGRGRGLVATRDLNPGEVILSVPFPGKVFCSLPAPQLELHWSADMALRLLQARHAAQAASSSSGSSSSSATSTSGRGDGSSAAGGSSGSGSDARGPAGGGWAPWLACLPEHVHTPLEWADEDVEALPEGGFRGDVVNMQEVIGACFWELEPRLADIGCGWPDFLWAVQVLHSRCFYEPQLQQHLTVPGVDMANHAANPSASVRLVHGSDTCQGVSAVAEVAPAPAAAGASCFQLVAGPEGIAGGDEVTISYGARWPAEVFVMLFGFVPEGHAAAGDAVVLYEDLGEVLGHVRRVVGEAAEGGGGPGEAAWQAAAAAAAAQLAAAAAAVPPGQVAGGPQGRFVATTGGVDGRLPALLDCISGAGGGGAARGWQALLRHRVQEELVPAYSGSMEGLPGLGQAWVGSKLAVLRAVAAGL